MRALRAIIALCVVAVAFAASAYEDSSFEAAYDSVAPAAEDRITPFTKAEIEQEFALLAASPISDVAAQHMWDQAPKKMRATKVAFPLSRVKISKSATTSLKAGNLIDMEKYTEFASVKGKWYHGIGTPLRIDSQGKFICWPEGCSKIDKGEPSAKCGPNTAANRQRAKNWQKRLRRVMAPVKATQWNWRKACIHAHRPHHHERHKPRHKRSKRHKRRIKPHLTHWLKRRVTTLKKKKVNRSKSRSKHQVRKPKKIKTHVHKKVKKVKKIKIRKSTKAKAKRKTKRKAKKSKKPDLTDWLKERLLRKLRV